MRLIQDVENLTLHRIYTAGYALGSQKEVIIEVELGSQPCEAKSVGPGRVRSLKPETQ